MRFLLCLLALLGLCAGPAAAFCGFYVSGADGDLFNTTSRVVFVRDRQTSVITMMSDYKGPTAEFAMIVPTPSVLKREQVRTVPAKTVDHLDAYSAPRLVEYYDYDPCNPVVEPMMAAAPEGTRGAAAERYRGAKALGVTIKEEYAVGEYDIVILAARQSDGLITFLTGEGYKIPQGAEAVLQDYIRMGMKFFVARVNLQRYAKGKAQELPPLQISFKSRDFMLPIQLGKINAEAAQDLLLMTLTRTGRVATRNYRMEALPSDVTVPLFVRKLFPDFYRATFDRTVGSFGVVMEYAWDMAWCDPCAADPLTTAELQDLGVGWLQGGENAGQDVFVTRLHVRYTKDSMFEDLKLIETKDKTNFQGRYILQHPYIGKMACEEGKRYLIDVRTRLRKEAVTVQELTGWDPRKIEKLVRAEVPASYW